MMPLANRVCLILAMALAVATPARAEPSPTTRPALAPAIPDACYRPDAADPAVRAACTLDVYAATDGRPAAVVVFFHGGGLMSGDKRDTAAFARVLAGQGVSVVNANYRLSPAFEYPAYVEDAAAAFAWAVAHADTLGVPKHRVFVGGYSAGGYLAVTLGCDARWLKAVNLNTTDVAGVIALSPQVFTHYAVRRERGEADWEWTPLIDTAAPVYHASKEAAPMRLFCGDADTPTRREEIEYFVALLKYRKHADARLTVVPGRNHGSIYGEALRTGDPVQTGVLEFVRTQTAGATTRPTP